jgi:hypothetical protein
VRLALQDRKEIGWNSRRNTESWSQPIDFACKCDGFATIGVADSCILLPWGGLPKIADTSAYLGVKSRLAQTTPGEEARMPILLWYLPFTMFSGACDLVFLEFETQMPGGRPSESVEPLREFAEPDNVG